VQKVLVVVGVAGAVGLAVVAFSRQFTYVWSDDSDHYQAPFSHADLPSWATASRERSRPSQ
jgi:hypothetical protein